MKLLTFKIYLRADQYKKGDGVIYLRVTLNRVHRYISLRIRVKEKNWNPSTCQVRMSEPNAFSVNQVIHMYETRAFNIRYEAVLRNKYLSLDEFVLQFSINYDSSSFYDFVANEVRTNKKLSPETLRGYDAQITKLQAFKKELVFAEIDSSFLNRYEKYMIDVLKNKPNTVTRTFSFIKSVINKARELNVTDIDPFEKRKLSFKEGHRNRLTIQELDSLSALYDSIDLDVKYTNVLRYFLFSCYTGLRYGDVQNLRGVNIIGDVISLQMKKTKNEIRIPIIDRAKKFLPDQVYGLKNLKVFRVLSNQKTNEYLKNIMEIAGIDKQISFHCARHSYATNGIELGIPLEVISQLLGHTDVKVTRIYAKYSDNVKARELEKWNLNDKKKAEEKKKNK